MANYILSVATKDTTISSGLMLETYGDQEPTGHFETANFNANGNLAAICKSVTGAVNGIGVNDNIVLVVPNVAFKSLIKVFIEAAYKKAPSGEKAVTALTAAQQRAFGDDYKEALVHFGDAVIAKRGKVRVVNAMNLYRWQLIATPNATEITAGQKITFEKVTFGDKDYAIAEGWRVLGSEMLPACEHTVEKRGEEYFVTRMLKIDNEYVTTVEALRRFRDGKFTPEHDGQARLINQMMLNACVVANLPRVAVVSRNFGTATA